ncbi:cation diffusion facilitator family transporter [Natronoglycomyces albus]|uniref:Cation transporter n=1 Tax=Natronoglycomyces albus TaxID=2811108 RepID=A0A895XZD1_9ACTN|nr:cation transporter [Natronoglycomyces albus]
MGGSTHRSGSTRRAPHGHDHHSHAPSVAAAATMGAKHRNKLWIALGLALTVMTFELITAFMTGSLALLSDAAHVGTDALGIGMALAAIIAVQRSLGRSRQTFGWYRLEVLAALGNTLLLFGVAIFVLVEAAKRLSDPPEVNSLPMLAVAIGALVVNVVSLLMLRAGAKESINIRGAYFEVLGDAVSSIGVITAAIIIWTTGWYYADSLMAVAVGLFILPRAWRLGRDALHILLQNAPKHLDMDQVKRSLSDIDGVEEVHDLHVWTLTSGLDVATVHLVLQEERANLKDVLSIARGTLEHDFGITHATLQAEPRSETPKCESIPY